MRETYAVFSYMRTTDIWDKFVESSHLIEGSLDEFDRIYPWGSDPAGEPGRPKRSKTQPRAGLRDLYCYWIDRQLASIETNADNWVRSARQKYETKYGNDPRGINWLATEMDPAVGSIRVGALRFLEAVGGGHQPTGVWANSNYDDLFDSSIGSAGPF